MQRQGTYKRNCITHGHNYVSSLGIEIGQNHQFRTEWT